MLLTRFSGTWYFNYCSDSFTQNTTHKLNSYSMSKYPSHSMTYILFLVNISRQICFSHSLFLIEHRSIGCLELVLYGIRELVEGGTANTNFTSFRFLKILRYFNISAAPPTTPKQLNDKCKYGLYKQTFTLDITIYVVKLCSDICNDSKSITI